MRKRLAQKILARMAREDKRVYAAYGKERCRQAFIQYYGYWIFYKYKQMGWPAAEEDEPDWSTIARHMYYKQFHKFGAATCRIKLNPREGHELRSSE